MRLLGYILLILGFVSMPFYFQAEYRVLGGELMQRAYAHVRDSGDTKTYTPHEIGDILFKAYQEAGKSVPVLCFPLFVMLAGGIILDVAGRKPRKVKDAA
jgi:hypothetical protein